MEADDKNSQNNQLEATAKFSVSSDRRNEKVEIQKEVEKKVDIKKEKFEVKINKGIFIFYFSVK